MKTTAAPILRAFGFRRVLILNAIVCVGFLAANGLFTPSTPHALIVGVLLVGGFFRSLEFTAVNAIAYADIRPANMSRATSFASVSQQVALSLGVAIAGLILQAARNLSGRGEIALIDFSIAFWIVSAISAISILFFVRLPRSAGAELAAPSRASSITAVTPKASAADPRGEATAPQ
jgi:MFS family permease